MSLPIEPQFWFRQVERSEKLRDGILDASSEIIKMWHGQWYRKEAEPQDPTPENFFYQWIQNVKPDVCFDNPRFFAKSNRSGTQKVVPLAMAEAVNRWAVNTRLWTTLDRAFDDCAYSYSVVMTTFEPDANGAGHAGAPRRHMPVSRRVAPWRWFCDDQVDHYMEARFAGHKWRRDKAQLLNDPRYNAAAVTNLVAEAGSEGWEKSRRQYDDSRGQIYGYEIWVPEATVPNHPQANHPDANGAILTLGVAQQQNSDQHKVAWIRDPRPWIGPPWGPYVLFGYNGVPNCPYPLSPFVAMFDQVKESNAHLTAAARSAARYKKFIGVDASNKKAATEVQMVADGAVALIPGLKEKSVQEIETGGVSENQQAYLVDLRDRLNRHTGISDNDAGDIDEDATATAVHSSNSRRDRRIALLKRAFIDKTTMVSKTAGYFLFTQHTSVFSLPQEIATQFVPRPADLPEEHEADQYAQVLGVDPMEVRQALEWNPRVIFGGGSARQPLTRTTGSDGQPTWIVSPNIPGTGFDDFEWELEPGSMERTDSALLMRNAIHTADLMAKFLPLMRQYPEVNWEEFWNMIGQPMNHRSLFEMLFNASSLRQMMGQMMPGQPGQGQPGQMPGQPGQTAGQSMRPGSDARMLGAELGAANRVA